MFQGVSYGRKEMSIIMDNQCYVVANDHPNYAAIVDAVKAKDYDILPKLVNVKKAIEHFGEGKVVVKDETIYYNGNVLHNTISKRMIEMMKDGFDISPMVKFLENLMQNPSKRSVDELYGFLDQHNIPITEDGHFLAYKAVRSDFTDKYSGKISNKVGEKPELPRNEVDDDYRNQCSYGLHVGGLAYSGPSGWFRSADDRVVICKVNPKDCVSVPDDHNRTKLRVCKYEVIGEYHEPLRNTVQSNVNESYSVPTQKLYPGDLVDFTYENAYRCGWISDVDDNYIVVELSEEDDHYDDLNDDLQIRKFIRSKVLDLTVLD